jgi:hypothetical protein
VGWSLSGWFGDLVGTSFVGSRDNEFAWVVKLFGKMVASGCGEAYWGKQVIDLLCN